MEITKEEILALKAIMDKALQDFTASLKKLNDAKYMVKAQSNNTVYVFKDTRESYGELVEEPKVVKAPVNSLPPEDI